MTEINDTDDRVWLSFRMTTETVRVWDPLVRIGHWILVIAFAIAYVTADDLLEIHEWAGYVVAAYVLIRMIWGFVGSEHARFKDFLYGPRQAIAYLVDTLRHRAKRYLGHSPAGGIMVFTLLIMLAGTTLTGMAELAGSYGEGPLSGLIHQQTASAQIGPSSSARDPASQDREERESTLRELHELFANVTLFLIVLHIAGVVMASLSHKENLVWSMIGGSKRSPKVGH